MTYFASQSSLSSLRQSAQQSIVAAKYLPHRSDDTNEPDLPYKTPVPNEVP